LSNHERESEGKLNGKKQELSNSKSIYCNSDGCFILHLDER